MAKNKSERVGRTEEKGKKITRRENVQSQSCRGRGGGGAERGRGRGWGGGEMEGSISNFSAEFTVDSFPIRLG